MDNESQRLENVEQGKSVEVTEEELEGFTEEVMQAETMLRTIFGVQVENPSRYRLVGSRDEMLEDARARKTELIQSLGEPFDTALTLQELEARDFERMKQERNKGKK